MMARIFASISFVGASAACLGVFRDWFSVQRVALEGGVTAGSATGTDLTVGMVALLSAAVAAIFSILWLARGPSPGLAAIVLLASLVAAASAGFVWATMDTRYVEYVAQTTSSDLSPTEIEELLEPLVAEDKLNPEVADGVILTSGGALAAALFSFFGALRSSPRRETHDRAEESRARSPREPSDDPPELDAEVPVDAGTTPAGRTGVDRSEDNQERVPEEGSEPAGDELPRRRGVALGDTWAG